MRDQAFKFFNNVFGVFVSIAVLGGVLVFILFVIGMIMGGEAGGSLMYMAYDSLSPYFIKAATIAILAGLVLFYISGEHALSLKEEKKAA
jgi:hypothetical protein